MLFTQPVVDLELALVADQYPFRLTLPTAAEVFDRTPLPRAVAQIDIELFQFEAIQQRKGQLACHLAVSRTQVKPSERSVQTRQAQERSRVLCTRQWQALFDLRPLALKLTRLADNFVHVGRRQARKVALDQ
ncbi:hypothetical protein D3C81_834160 [compost metagenome]